MKLKKHLIFIRYQFLIFISVIIRHVVNAITLLDMIFGRCRLVSKGSRVVAVYMIVNNRFFFDMVRSFFSLVAVMPNIDIKIIDDGTLSSWKKKSLKYIIGENVSIIENSETLSQLGRISQYKYIYAFARYGWSGVKFILPLLDTTHKKVIVLDSDTIFFKPPEAIIKWIKSGKKYHLYTKDYDQFSIISGIEARVILGTNPKFKLLNSGLLCIDLQDYWQHNSLNDIDIYIKKIISVVKDRKDKDLNSLNDFVYVFPIIEQTLHWLTLLKCKTLPLPSEYFVFPAHKYRNLKINNPVFIHYAGENLPVNKPLNKYLFVSMVTMVIDWILGKNVTGKIWFTHSQLYCFHCRHTVVPNTTLDFRW